MNTGLETSFIIDGDLELGMEFSVFVRAFTGGGPGEITFDVVLTLTRPREKCFLVVYAAITCTLSSHTQLL